MASPLSISSGTVYSPSTSAPATAKAAAAEAPPVSISELATQCADGFESKKTVRSAVESLIQWADTVGDELEPAELESARAIFMALPEADRAAVVCKLAKLDQTAAIAKLSPKKPSITENVLNFAKSVYGNWAAASLINGAAAGSSSLGIAAMFGRGLCCPNIALTVGVLTGAAALGTALKRNLVEE